jgi:hypothetical protein
MQHQTTYIGRCYITFFCSTSVFNPAKSNFSTQHVCTSCSDAGSAIYGGDGASEGESRSKHVEYPVCLSSYCALLLMKTGLTGNRDPDRIKNGYTVDCIWRNRNIFIRGHDEIVSMLTRKWQKEKNYKLRKELFAFTDNKVCNNVHFLWAIKTHPGEIIDCRTVLV